MLTVYIDFDYYEANGGEIPRDAFVKYEAKARATIDYYTFGKVAEPYDPKIRECMIELMDFQYKADSISDDDKGSISSESVGNYSVSYTSKASLLGLKTGSDSGKSREKIEYEIVVKHLMNTGLMYRGV